MSEYLFLLVLRLLNYLTHCVGESRPSDKVCVGGGGGRSQKIVFRPVGPQFGLQIRGGLSPGSVSALFQI